jgi:hypothetical protein
MDATVERKDIVDLLESLCEHPLADGQAQPSTELEAFRLAVAKALSRDGAARPEEGDSTDAARLRAALAALLSGTAGEGVRRSVADAVLRSPAARLDVQSALAFVDAIEPAPQSAPACLLDKILAREGAPSDGPAAARKRAGSANIWSQIVGRSWPARGWRVAVCTVLLVVGVAPVFRMQTTPAPENAPPSPMVETASKPAAVVDSPAQPQPALATSQPCAPRRETGEAANAQSIAPAEPPTPAISATAADCAPTPGRTFADHPAESIEAVAARQRAEAARQAAAAREAAKIGAAQTDHSPAGSPIEVDRPGAVLGTTDRSIPTPARPAAPAAPAAGRKAQP